MRISDWSSDVCSSDLQRGLSFDSAVGPALHRPHRRCADRLGRRPVGRLPQVFAEGARRVDRESVVYGKRVSVRVDLGGRRIINKKNVLTRDIIGGTNKSYFEHTSQILSITTKQ